MNRPDTDEIFKFTDKKSPSEYIKEISKILNGTIKPVFMTLD